MSSITVLDTIDIQEAQMQLNFEFQKQFADESNILAILLLKSELSWKIIWFFFWMYVCESLTKKVNLCLG